MTINDAYGLIATGHIKKDQSDFVNAKALGIDFNSATWSIDFITLCIASGKGLAHAMQVIDFLCGARLGAHGIMSKRRAEFLNGFASALAMVKLGEISIGEITPIR